MHRSDSIENDDRETLLAISERSCPQSKAQSRILRSSGSDRPKRIVLLALLATTSILLNCWLLALYITVSQPRCTRLEEHRSPFTDLALDVPTTYHHHSDWWGSNTTHTDELWESIDTDPMVVALDDQFVQDHGLPASDRFPWDHGKGRYFLKVFHDLHCLKFIHHYTRDLQTSNTTLLDGTHVHHCLDTLRQDVLCRADDTPMPTTDALRAIGDNQPLMCKNYDKLVEWAYAPERHACHRSLSDYKPIVNSVERYAFCEEGSENEKVMREWFKGHGHRDPWG